MYKLLLLVSIGLITSVNAHFQLVYTPELSLDRGGEITFKMPFTHPAISGVVMATEFPLAAYSVKKGKTKDLISAVKPIQWGSQENRATAYELTTTLRGLGDNLIVMVPTPYFEKEEGKYIQQITKSIVNIGGLPTDWSTPLNLEVEIVPLTKPYAIRKGGLFSGIAMGLGKPVPFAEVEIEYLNYVPDTETNRFADTPNINQKPLFATETIRADSNGVFNYVLTQAGQWGFAALDLIPNSTYQGQSISKDAVIWVQAQDVEQAH